jgi:hypothetical protein
MCSDSNPTPHSPQYASRRRQAKLVIPNSNLPTSLTSYSQGHESIAPSVQWHSPIRQRSRNLPRHRPNRSRSHSRARRVPITVPVPYFDQIPTQPPLPPSPARSALQFTLLAKTPRTRPPSPTEAALLTIYATTRPLQEPKDSLHSRVPPWQSSS